MSPTRHRPPWRIRRNAELPQEQRWTVWCQTRFGLYYEVYRVPSFDAAILLIDDMHERTAAAWTRIYGARLAAVSGSIRKNPR